MSTCTEVSQSIAIVKFIREVTEKDNEFKSCFYC